MTAEPGVVADGPICHGLCEAQPAPSRPAAKRYVGQAGNDIEEKTCCFFRGVAWRSSRTLPDGRLDHPGRNRLLPRRSLSAAGRPSSSPDLRHALLGNRGCARPRRTKNWSAGAKPSKAARRNLQQRPAPVFPTLAVSQKVRQTSEVKRERSGQ